MAKTRTQSWSTKTALQRLEGLVTAVPKPIAGGGTQSASSSGFIGYALDMQILQEVVRVVLVASTCREPHPQLGDDGHQREVRDRAIKALFWCERWIELRNREGWEPKRFTFMQEIPGDSDAE